MTFTDPRVTAHVKAMSDALIKVRPLGGSELFTAIRLDGAAEIFLADAAFCGAEIDRMHRELHDLRIENALQQRELTARRAHMNAARVADRSCLYAIDDTWYLIPLSKRPDMEALDGQFELGIHPVTIPEWATPIRDPHAVTFIDPKEL